MTPRHRTALLVSTLFSVALTACTVPAPPAAPAAAPDDAQAARPHAAAPYLLHVKCPHVPDPLPGEAPPAPVGPPQRLTPGHWEWVEGNYVWAAPQWHPRADGPARAWQDGYWEANGGACVWHNGRYVLMGMP
jgi:hypothetical protein